MHRNRGWTKEQLLGPFALNVCMISCGIEWWHTEHMFSVNTYNCHYISITIHIDSSITHNCECM